MWIGFKSSNALLMLLLVGFVSCTEQQDVRKGGSIISITGEAIQELVELQPMRDGGFVVGINTFAKGDQDIHILKYDRSMKLEWQEIIQIPGEDDLHKLLITDEGEILVCGTTTGYLSNTQDTSKPIDIRPYFHLFSPDGKTIWRQASKIFYPIVLTSSEKGHLITDAIKLSSGDYLIASRFAGTHYGDVNHSDYLGLLMEVDANGFRRNIQSTKSDYMEAIYPIGDDRVAVFFSDSRFNKELGFYVYRENILNGSDAYISKTSVPWASNTLSRLNGSIDHAKFTHDKDQISYNIAFPDRIMNYKYTISTGEMTSQTIRPNIGTIYRFKTVDEKSAMVCTSDGRIVIMDDEFHVINSFEIGWVADKMCKTSEGDFLIAKQTLNNINLFMIDEDGDWKDQN